MSEFLYLLLGHYLADFPLQGDFLSGMKGKNNYLLLCHVLIYTLILGAILTFFGMFTTPKLWLLFVSHFTVDYWKCHYAPKDTALTTSLYIDQAIHIAMLFLLCLN